MAAGEVMVEGRKMQRDGSVEGKKDGNEERLLGEKGRIKGS